MRRLCDKIYNKCRWYDVDIVSPVFNNRSDQFRLVFSRQLNRCLNCLVPAVVTLGYGKDYKLVPRAFPFVTWKGRDKLQREKPSVVTRLRGKIGERKKKRRRPSRPFYSPLRSHLIRGREPVVEIEMMVHCISFLTWYTFWPYVLLCTKRKGDMFWLTLLFLSQNCPKS